MMKKELEESYERSEQDFKSQVLIHRPEFYSKLMESEPENDKEQSSDFKYVVPESEEELQEVLADMRALGLPVSL